MDSQSITNLFKVLLILLGIGSLIFGIVKVIMAKKKGKGILGRIATIAVSVMGQSFAFLEARQLVQKWTKPENIFLQTIRPALIL